MQSIYKTTQIMSAALLMHPVSFAQVKTSDLFINKKQEIIMDKIQSVETNKATIHHLYEDILNKRQFELLKDIVAAEYTGISGEKGIEVFRAPVHSLVNAFPDAHWKIVELIGEGNTIIVKQTFSGTHTSQFQHIAATGKTVTSNGIATYELKDGKIIKSQVMTDRLGFLQDLGVLPKDIAAASNKKVNKEEVRFIDRFLVPKNSIEAFRQRMNYNRNFIRHLPGFINDEVYQQKDEAGNLIVITIAVWADEEKVNNAKNAVQAEYKRIGFNPLEFYSQLNIKLERGHYKKVGD
jgi:predicted ester cyclase/heme-degrading monooxygenase HmoA